MHTIGLIDEALALAHRAGYAVRQEWLAGSGGGCEIGGRKWLFLDLALSPAERLEQILDVLRREPLAAELSPGHPLLPLLAGRD